MEGYGKESKRESLVDSTVEQLSPLPSTFKYVAPCALKVTEVLSYRNNLRGTYVPDYQADPYHGFLTLDAAAQQKRLKEKIAKGEASGKTGTKFPPSIDTGHAYYKLVRTVNTSARGQRYVFRSDPGFTTPVINRGGPFFAYSATVAPLHQSRMPFKFPANGNDTSTQNSAWKAPAIIPAFQLNDYGKRAISKVAPTSPSVGGLGAILELIRDFPELPLKQLLNSKKGLHKKFSGEFLNYQFGVLPTASDAIKIARVLMNITRLLKQYEKDAGNGVERKFFFPLEEKSEVFTTDQLSNQGTVGMQNSPAPWRSGGSTTNFNLRTKKIESTLTMQSKRSVRFIGSFSYVLPLGNAQWAKFDRYMAEADKLFGLTGLQTVWNLFPWSWLVDWFVDIQSSIALYDRIQSDNLVINYGYVSAKTSFRAVQHSELTYYDGDVSPFKSVNTVFESFRFERIRANPYGFIGPTGTSGGLSAIQMAILAALGMNRV